MKIAYLGPKGSFTHAAAQDYFSTEELIPFSTIPACLQAVEKEQVGIGVVPIENTIEGTVNQTLDYLFHKASLNVIGELVMPISQNLLVTPEHDGNLSCIKKVYSHPQALAQCQEFVAEYLPNAVVIATDSTSQAAELIATTQEPTAAAIGPVMSGQEYGLKLLKKDIQDISQNKTRFWLVSKKKEGVIVESGKASICFTMPNNLPGALQKMLTTFSWREINLSKIESRPLKTQLGEYFFLIDIVYHALQRPLLINALAEVESLGGKVKELGIYDITHLTPL